MLGCEHKQKCKNTKDVWETFDWLKMHGNVSLLCQYTFKFVILSAPVEVMALFLKTMRIKWKRRVDMLFWLK